MSWNLIEDKGAKNLAWLTLRKNTTLKTLHLYGNPIEGIGITSLKAMLKKNKTLTPIDFSGLRKITTNPLKKMNEYFMNEVATNTSGTIKPSRDLVEMLIKKPWLLRWFFEKLNNYPRIKTLDLSGNGIKDTGAEVLAKAFVTNTTLMTLDLSDNTIQDKVLKKIETHISDNRMFCSWNYDEKNRQIIYISNIDGRVATITKSEIEQNVLIDIDGKQIRIPIKEFENNSYLQAKLHFNNKQFDFSAIGEFLTTLYNHGKDTIPYYVEQRDVIKNFFNDLVFLACTYMAGQTAQKSVANIESTFVKQYFHDPEFIKESFDLLSYFFPGNDIIEQKLLKISVPFIFSYYHYNLKQRKAIKAYLSPYIEKLKTSLETLEKIFPDKTIITSTSPYEATLTLLDPNAKKLIATFNKFEQTSISPDGTIRVELKNFKQIINYKFHTIVTNFNTINLLSIQTNEILLSIRIANLINDIGEIISVAFSSDGMMLAYKTDDQKVRLLNIFLKYIEKIDQW